LKKNVKSVVHNILNTNIFEELRYCFYNKDAPIEIFLYLIVRRIIFKDFVIRVKFLNAFLVRELKMFGKHCFRYTAGPPQIIFLYTNPPRGATQNIPKIKE
jgi:hypothetical protein